MADSISDRLHRMKSTCEERLERIESVKKEIEKEKLKIEEISKVMPSDRKLYSLKHDVTKVQLSIETIKDEFKSERDKQESIHEKLKLAEEQFQEAYQKASILSEEVVHKHKELTFTETAMANKCNKFHELYLMSLEDLSATSLVIQQKSNNNTLGCPLTESLAWKKKVLHAARIERNDYEMKLKEIEENIQLIVDQMMNE